MSDVKLDEKDIEILRLLQDDSKLSMKDMARKVGSPITTVYSKIRRMEKLGVLKGYRAIVNGKMVDMAATAFILASFGYRPVGGERPLSQREISKRIAEFPEVQEVHIISGDWDILIKVKARDVEAVGRFVVDKLRTVKGVEKTLTCMVFETVKETTNLTI